MSSINNQLKGEHISDFNSGDQQITGPKEDDASHVRYLSWGIFNVACEVQSRSWCWFSGLMLCRRPFHFFIRFIKELWRIDPLHSLEYYLYTLWLAVSPALSLSLASLTILKASTFSIFVFACSYGGPPMPQINQAFEEGQGERDIILDGLQLLVVAWLFCGLMTHRVHTLMSDLRAKLGGALRAHFLPKLVKAHLQRDDNELEGVFPYPSDFGDFIPGWDFFTETFDRLRHITAVMASASVLIYFTSLLDVKSDAYVLVGLLFLFFINVLFLPINAAGGVGYTFWTTNPHYNRLMALFNIVFDQKYRFSLAKDGLVDYFIKEYNDVSEALGVVEADTWAVGWGLPPSWYWGIVQSWLIKDPMALCALFLLWTTSRSALSAMIIFQLAIFNMRDSVDVLKHANARTSLLVLWGRAEALYQVIDATRKSPSDLSSLDDHGGAEIDFSNVSYKYPDSSSPAIEDLNLKIRRGQVVVITGPSASGKTTFLKLLCGLLQAADGEVLINGKTISNYRSRDLRRKIAFIGQSEVIYPLSLKENIFLGLANPSDYDMKDEEEFQQAAHLAGCLDFFKSYKDTLLEPCSIPSYSFQQMPGKAAIEAMERETSALKGRQLSPGESQPIFAARGFMRIRRGHSKIVILDDPFNALDTIAERAILENFLKIAKEKRQTIIIVTQRLAYASKADLILCMNKGRLEEQGTHDELVASAGRYSALFKAQELTWSGNI